MPSITLIVTTYNWPEALDCVLTSILNQTLKPLEVIVADDGSQPETRLLIKNHKLGDTLFLRHSWHEDQGFRVAMTRNKAIALAIGEYIILIDGDMILHPNFIEDHFGYALPGFFVQGMRTKLSNRGTVETLKSKNYWFKTLDSRLKSKRYGLRNTVLSKLFSGKALVMKLKGLQSCNMAFSRDDCLAVNGFNEDFIGWGREDSEFGARLINNGVIRRNLRFAAVAYHLHHEGRSRAMLERNHLIYQRTVKERLTWCSNGIDKYLITPA